MSAAGELHPCSYNMNTKHAKTLTEKWKGMALQLGEFCMVTVSNRS